ncbi:MAG TPA: hypothetical protein VHB77_01870 [Planctomycetaceae bacterium]|nr:hypothetical protein [Planctomycetaceae bacterium]
MAMLLRISLSIALLFGVLAVCTIATAADGRSALLLDVARGQKPNDTGTEQTKTAIVEQAELGGRALEVNFAPGDTFGMQSPRTTDWSTFKSLQFEAFNPASKPAALTLNVFHKDTTNYQARVVVPIRLEPGKNAVRLNVADFKNVNGSTPKLTAISKWYIAAEDGSAPKLYFGPISLTANADAGAPREGRPSAFRVTGKIGGQDVNLTVTPVEPESDARTARPNHGVSDPARLKRIQSARMPRISKPVPLDTPEADAILSALEVLPPDNPWNTLVGDWPVHPDSKQIVAAIGADQPLRYNPDMAYVLVPADQPRIPVKLTEYADESDAGPYPVPDILPIEGWPAEYQRRANGGKYTLDDVQRDRENAGGDRHSIVVDHVNRMLYEFYATRKTDAGWQAAGAAIFDLKSNRLRPDGWTSTDAAGLPLFPAIVRHDELKRGVIDHALRVTVPRSRKSYVYPATHQAGHGTEPSLPRMGERLRLRKDFDVSRFSPEARTILVALQRYGMLVADNGIAWAISVAPDPRIPVLHDELRKVSGSDFEVIQPPPGYEPPE